ncbi:Serine/threonine-protein kinase StkP [Planctomycetales bacterium 10988]|nr:Serine/threonine-protein kinase StkP [Planctomycetales bacterium 10988]
MEIVALKTFLATLHGSQLLSRDQWSSVRNFAESTPDTKSVARYLLKKSFLTRWQVEQLLRGQKHFYFSQYKLLEKIGEGGMGAVYRAEQSHTQRMVALKMMDKKLLTKKNYVARFLREMRAAASLNHPNIVTALDAGEAEGIYYLVMEYVEAHDLRGWLKEFHHLPIDWSCEIIMQTAEGMQHAHERGLVHRDIKPANILVCAGDVSDPPRVKLLDLGLARIIDDDESEHKVDSGELTGSGQVLGTPDYMAPEQARSTKTVDVRGDIFALGCTLFKMLAGRLPFEGGNAFEKLMARTTQDAPSLLSIRPEVSPELDAVVARMLARNPRHRYQQPKDVVKALAPFALSTKEDWQYDPEFESQSVILRQSPLSYQYEPIQEERDQDMEYISAELETLPPPVAADPLFHQPPPVQQPSAPPIYAEGPPLPLEPISETPPLNPPTIETEDNAFSFSFSTEDDTSSFSSRYYENHRPSQTRNGAGGLDQMIDLIPLETRLEKQIVLGGIIFTVLVLMSLAMAYFFLAN